MRKLTLAFWVWASAAAPAAAEGMNVVWIVFDTARADHTTPYGYARDTTPQLARLASEGVTFEAASAQADWTRPAMASLLTGRRPASHGVFQPQDRLAATETTLPQAFKEHGFQTAAFVGSPLLTGDFCRGFDVCRWPGRSFEASASAAERWLERNSQERFFLLLHGFDAHYPYACPQAWRERFLSTAPAAAAAADYTGEVVYALNFAENSGRAWRRISKRDLQEAEAIRADGQARQRLVAQYDGCLAYEDSQLSRLFATLDRLGLRRNTLVAFMSDHGEEFGEHGGYGHAARPLHQEIAHIPLILAAPAGPRGRRLGTPMEQIDLFPTLMELEGWPTPSRTEGRSLTAALKPDGPPLAEAALWAQGDSRAFGPSRILDLEAFRRGRWKVVRQGSRWSLYDLAADPGEAQDRSAAEPGVFLDLAGQLMGLKVR